MTMRHMRGDPAEGPSDTGGQFPHTLLVRDRMTKPAVTVTPTTTLTEALRLMALRRIHYLPVLDEHGTLVGIVNSDDVLGTRARRTRGEAVGVVMSAPAVSVAPTMPLADAMRLMADRGVGALPVVTDGGVVGILTQSDVVAVVARGWPA